jgi:hypothetical protein
MGGMVASALGIYQNIVKNQPKIDRGDAGRASGEEESSEEVDLTDLLQGKATTHETPYTSQRPTNAPISSTHTTADFITGKKS